MADFRCAHGYMKPFKLKHRYTTLNRDWKRITRANTFLCKKRESIETMRVSPSTPKLSSKILFYHEKEEVTNEYKRLFLLSLFVPSVHKSLS